MYPLFPFSDFNMLPNKMSVKIKCIDIHLPQSIASKNIGTENAIAGISKNRILKV